MSLSPGAKESPNLDQALCRACRQCAARSVCRTKAIRSIDPGEAPFIDGHLCMACYECVGACPYGAIIQPVSVVQNV
jgi:Fe-S-cluster-containing hydrogenase component 2